MNQKDYDAIIEAIKANSVESSMRRYARQNEPEPYYGVTMSTLVKIAKPYFKDHELARALWNSGILDAQVVAVHMIDPKTIDFDTLWSWCDPKVSVIVLDKLVAKVLDQRKDLDLFEERLLKEADPVLQRIGWNLTIRRVVKGKVSKDELVTLFEKIRHTLPTAPEPLKWSVNHCLCEIGVYNDDWTERCITLGEEIGAYEDMVVSKGCTSAYAPEWIEVARKNRAKRRG